MKKSSLHVMQKEDSPDITPDTFQNEKKVSRVPALAGLPEYLKDPEVYKKVRRASYEMLGSTCGHSEALEWAACVKCQRKVRDHADMLRKLGFTSPAQYYAWRKTHEETLVRCRLYEERAVQGS